MIVINRSHLLTDSYVRMAFDFVRESKLRGRKKICKCGLRGKELCGVENAVYVVWYAKRGMCVVEYGRQGDGE